jgi:hypothetical protein
VAYLLRMHRASGALVVGVIGVLATGSVTAQAGPTVRFGLTGAVEDQAAPSELELGPMVGAGMRFGPVIVDADYTYLSFFEHDVGAGGMQRVGVNLRADLMRTYHRSCYVGLGCVGGTALYIEAGVAERFGQWHLDAVERSPAGTDRTHEEHVGAGIELDNSLEPHHHGWQLGARLAITPHDPLQIDGTCRGSCMPVGGKLPMSSGGQDYAFLLEWMFLFGK